MINIRYENKGNPPDARAVALIAECEARMQTLGGIARITSFDSFEGMKYYWVHVFGTTVSVMGVTTASSAT